MPAKQCFAISSLLPAWLEEVQQSYDEDQDFQNLIASIVIDPSSQQHYSYDQGILRYNGRLCVGSHEALRKKLTQNIHSYALGGHSGISNTSQRMKSTWKGLKRNMKDFIATCDICLQNKAENCSYP